MVENKKILEVYNNSEVIAGSGYTMKNNYIVPLVERMIAEKIIKRKAGTVLQIILQYKHGKDNPFPSQSEVAKLLGRSISYVKQAVSSIASAGLLKISKIGRSNSYNFQPFFDLLERFILEYKYNGNVGIKISELLNASVEKTEIQDFTWTNEYKGEKESVKNVSKKVNNPVTEEVEESNVILPESILNVCKLHKIDSKGMDAIESSYDIFGEELHDDIFIEKINVSAGKENFVHYYNSCIINASKNKEKPNQVATKPIQKKANRDSNEPVLDWFEDNKKQWEEKDKANREEQSNQPVKSVSELLKEYQENVKIG